jgi:RecJ-like exonuclease
VTARDEIFEDHDSFFADLEAAPEEPCDDAQECPRCDGQGHTDGWSCTLCDGSGNVVTIKRKGWDD